jgi:hypothetical protein
MEDSHRPGRRTSGRLSKLETPPITLLTLSALALILTIRIGWLCRCRPHLPLVVGPHRQVDRLPAAPLPSDDGVLALFLLWLVIAVPPLDSGQVRELTEPVSPRGKKQEGIRKRRHEVGAGHRLKGGK